MLLSNFEKNVRLLIALITIIKSFKADKQYCRALGMQLPDYIISVQQKPLKHCNAIGLISSLVLAISVCKEHCEFTSDINECMEF